MTPKSVFHRMCIYTALYLALSITLSVMQPELTLLGLAFSWLPAFISIRLVIASQPKDTKDPLTWKKVLKLWMRPSKVFQNNIVSQ